MDKDLIDCKIDLVLKVKKYSIFRRGAVLNTYYNGRLPIGQKEVEEWIKLKT